ncbi:enoyl-CoA hydratase/isomerase family protein [Tessaracoccus sp. MC1679]|uniref:enoyl-CoA hydratase/isomerase family protein n=1 Tax=Tessaracoccus sp. MC1679 TaxID=2760313 RepID=UPI0015FEC0F5|nr:enoyl-CoA hydratase/isomerase family protein [Tessaracoccus sp. MC1679]MBB1516685.1 enoyl-CoA hydratase/isomerase family protein [Tessaracoccus sp. MC1679]
MATVDLHRQGSIAVITLNNTGKRNAMTDDMWRRIPTLMRGLDADPEVAVVVLTGAGGTFCAGSDISGLDELHHAEGPINAELALARSPKPVIAAIEGACFGGGLELAVGCDLRVAGDSATFSVPPATLGIVYPVSATQRMIHLMGPAVTKEMLFTAARLDAQRALSVGLLNAVVEGGQALETAIVMGERMAGLSQLTLRASKEIVDGLVARDLGAETAISWVQRANSGPDLPEGIAAFRERRPARFTWRPE